MDGPTINRFELGGQHLAAQFGAASNPTSGLFTSPTVEAAQHRATPGPMRKLQVFSDLHHDINRRSHPGTAGLLAIGGVDCVVVAGDTMQGIDQALAALRNAIPLPCPIAMVAGNHEFYRRHWATEVEIGRQRAAEYGISFLEDDVDYIGGIRFIGATLWTDYELDGAHVRGRAMATASAGLNDHRLITWNQEPWQRFRPQEARALHLRSIKFIERTLSTPFVGPTVVVTHHAPHRDSIDSRFAGSPLNPAFASDLSDLIMRHQPALWVHGHIHCSADYLVGRTRVLCNPAGYGRENIAFDPGLVVELSLER